jgi:type 1 fimbria pilin
MAVRRLLFSASLEEPDNSESTRTAMELEAASGALGLYATDGSASSATALKIEGSKQLNGEITDLGTVVPENCEVTGTGKGIAF